MRSTRGAMFVPLEEFAVANAELGQRGSLISRELRLGLVDWRRDFPQNWIGAEISDDATDGVCVDGLNGVFVDFWGHRYNLTFENLVACI